MNKEELKNKIRELAQKEGFDLVGFSKAKIDEKYLKAFGDWLEEGREGGMLYMRKIEQRRDLTTLLPGAKAVIVLITNYYNEQEPLKEGSGRVARYAYGRDYHKVIGKKLKNLQKMIKEWAPESESKAYVDTGSILERALAEQAGLGRIGKNSCLITEDFGSWVFISEIITTLDLAPSAPQLQKTAFNNPEANSFNVCGGCTRCITACPTGAIIAPGVVDARLCISYLTIENKGDIPPRLAKVLKKSKTLFGCDICQEVCPHNQKRQTPTSHASLRDPKIAGDQLPLAKIQSIRNDEQYLKNFAGSPLMRAKKEGLKRNAEAL